MEKKIGEIFKCNGEWYQCCEMNKDAEYQCDGCCFVNDKKCHDTIGACFYREREDGKFAIFKKLKKATNTLFKKYPNGKLLQGYHIEKPFILPENVEEYCFYNAINDILYIEIKTDKPFDLEAAKAGKPVCTRDGRKARIICFDRNASSYNIVALIECKNFPNKEEEVKVYTNDGKYIRSEKNCYDLMMLPEKHEGWVNVYNSLGVITFSHNPFDTKEEALTAEIESPHKDYVDTVKIEWEE